MLCHRSFLALSQISRLFLCHISVHALSQITPCSVTDHSLLCHRSLLALSRILPCFVTDHSLLCHRSLLPCHRQILAVSWISPQIAIMSFLCHTSVFTVSHFPILPFFQVMTAVQSCCWSMTGDRISLATLSALCTVLLSTGMIRVLNSCWKTRGQLLWTLLTPGAGKENQELTVILDLMF